MAKVDLSLLKRLVSELDDAVVAMEKARSEKTATVTPSTPNVEVVVEASKAAGLAAGVMQEAALLIMDIQSVSQGNPKSKGSDALSSLLGATFKGPGSNN